MSRLMQSFSRRQFIQGAAAVAGASVIAPLSTTLAQDAATKRTATDIVTLNKTGIKLSRVGIGTGANNGADNLRQGKDEFIKVIRHAYDSGITYIDCAKRYATYTVFKDAIKGLPREKLYLQSKYWPGDSDETDLLTVIDEHRKVFDTDYIDSLLVHCREEPDWTDRYKRLMDAYNDAKDKKWIRVKGVSCHSYEALTQAQKVTWADIHLVRINPLGMYMDGPNKGWNASSTNPIQPILDEIKAMHDKGRGVIGMKIFGNGDMKDPADRERSIRSAMSNPNIDAIVIGMLSTQHVDENLKLVNKVLAEPAA